MAFDLNKLRKQREAEKGRRDIFAQSVDLAYRMGTAGDARQVGFGVGAWFANPDGEEFYAQFDPEMWTLEQMQEFVDMSIEVAMDHNILLVGGVFGTPEDKAIGFILERGELAAAMIEGREPEE